MIRFAFLALLLCAGLADAQSVSLPPQIRGENEAWIHIKPIKVDGGSVRWRIDPGLEEISPDIFLPPEAAKLFIGKLVKGTPGKYKVEAWNAKGDLASDIATCWIVIGGVAPPPPPPPTERPKALTFLVIGPTIKTAIVTENAEFRTWLRSNSIGIYGITTKQQQDANKKFAGIPSPAIVLQDANNDVIAHSPITTIEAAMAFVTKHMGK